MGQVTLENVTKKFGAVSVIPEINLTIPKGSFTVLVGPSGCGKSTLLRLIAGLEEVSEGSIVIGDRDVTELEPSKRGIAMVFQSYALYPHMSVAENIGFPLEMEKRPKPEIDAAVNDAAGTLRLTDYLERKPKDLSGGQRQRVAIGRAIVRKPDVFLFDEPLSNLDASLRSHMRVELSDLHRRMDATMIYVTHDQVEAMTLADRIVVLRDGRIEQVGSPDELFNRPQTPFVAGFIGSPNMNLIEGPLACDFKCDVLGIRPEDFERCLESEALVTGSVRHLENLGSEVIVYVHSPDLGEVLWKTPIGTSVAVSDSVSLKVLGDKMHRFADNARL